MPVNGAEHCELGNTLFGASRFAEALLAYERAIALDPTLATAHLNRGTALLCLARYSEALAAYAEALALHPHLPAAHVGRGTAFLELARPDQALGCYDAAITLEGGLAQAYMGRGRALKELGSDEAAIGAYRRAIELQGSYPQAHYNCGNLLQELNRWEEALASYDQAIASKPDFAQAHSARGIVLQFLRRVDEALASYERAIAIDPTLAAAHFSRATALLLKGDFARGWAEFEWRWKTEGGRNVVQAPALARPWLGNEPLEGQTILLYAEQGFGDTIQFCRYAKQVSELGARVLLLVPRALSRLLASLEGVAHLVVLEDHELPPFDCYCPLLSLPLALRATVANIPAEVPYLRSTPECRNHWRARLGMHDKPRVGLTWSGGFRPDQAALWAVNRRRNISLAALAPLKNSGIEFYSLQKGEAAEAELAALRSARWDGPKLIDLTAELHDFADTAALIEQLDLVISVDTATVHLAGALGKPVWVLNHFGSCWRWLLERTDTPWYPTARLCRQERPGDWEGVVSRVRTDLQSLFS